MTKKAQIDATTIRTTMTVAVIIIILMLATGFYFVQDILKTYATDVNVIVSSATSKDSNSSSANQNQSIIAQYQAPYNKAIGLTMTDKDYESIITQDLSKYASSTGITAINYSFSKTSTISTPAANPIQINGININYATIKFNNSVKFTNFMQFLKLIENSTPKMQITDIKLSPAPNSKDSITVESLTIEFYIR